MTFDFQDQSALVTGGLSGIGAAIVRLLLDSGARVFVADPGAGEPPADVEVFPVDVSSQEDMSALVQRIVDSTGRIDCLFNNAGINSFQSLAESTVEDLERVFRVNTRGVFVGMKAVLPHMLAAGRGAIVNVGSVASLIGIADRPAYSASKGAISALSRQVAVQYASAGIRVNVVHPGTTDSPMLAAVIEAADNPDAARAAVWSRQPIGRPAAAREVASAAIFLASESASYITGVELPVDGGWSVA